MRIGPTPWGEYHLRGGHRVAIAPEALELLYCNHRFIELESLAPLAVLEPGQSSVHIETWGIYRDVAVRQSIEGLSEVIQTLAL